jgi:hypothetical protein
LPIHTTKYFQAWWFILPALDSKAQYLPIKKLMMPPTVVPIALAQALGIGKTLAKTIVVKKSKNDASKDDMLAFIKVTLKF